MRCLLATLVAVVLLAAVSGHVRQEKIPPNRCLPGQGCFPSRAHLAEFAATLTGALYQPSDNGYSGLVRNLNNRMIRHPALIVEAGDVGDVQRAMKFARKYQLQVTSSTTNDDFTGRSTYDGSLQINLSRLTQVSTLQTSSRSEFGEVKAQAGAIWEDVYEAARVLARDVVAPNALKSAVGNTVGDGGVGPLVRIYGLVADNLLEAQVVTADGSLVTVSEYSVVQDFGDGLVRKTFDRAFLAAIAGGGVGPWGVVTSYTFKMHQAPVSIVRARFTYKLWEAGSFVGQEVLQAVVGAVPILPEKWGGYVYLSGVTSQALPDTKGELIVDLFYYDTWRADSDYDFINNIININAPDSLTSSSVTNQSSILDFERSQPRLTSEVRYYGFNSLLQPSDPPAEDEADRLTEALLFTLNNPTIESTYYCSLQVMGGAASVAPGNYSHSLVNPHLRSAYASLTCDLLFPGRGLEDAFYVSHVMDFRQLLAPFSGGKDHYWAEEDVPDWKQQFHGDTYGELIQIKLKYDVDNYLWCHNCVGSDFRLDCRYNDAHKGLMLSGYVTANRYASTRRRDREDSEHRARLPYINQMSMNRS
ncbi:VAO-type flavoprotein oxidase VAO615 [Aplysia californica]|uniref:VAO-type flavoprotein oxidase VAO615 n=1 Tax=Aplysia californica TaxID=6500 RepID=A0ABM0ZX16_APLCA|nr:VAO-type flavoprotein oxidase VAO615 [Aplysia californica]